MPLGPTEHLLHKATPPRLGDRTEQNSRKINLPGAEFKTLVIRMFNDLGNNFNKEIRNIKIEIRNIKKNQSEVKNIITEMKNTRGNQQ